MQIYKRKYLRNGNNNKKNNIFLSYFTKIKYDYIKSTRLYFIVLLYLDRM